jgi:lipid-binding SYLF domain-containing protein
MNRTILATLGVFALAVAPISARPPDPPRTIQAATDVLNDFAALPAHCLPASLLAEAHGVAIIPGVVKAGFLVGGRGGHGLIATRDHNGAWSGVTFVDLGGASFGLQAGVESADVVLVFRTRESLERILRGRGKLTLGADAAIAAGPVGRQAEAATDARLRAEILSYSRSRGLFAGVALDGAAIVYDHRANADYLNDHRPETLQLTTNLLARLVQFSTPAPPRQPVTIQAPVFVPAPPVAPPVAPPPPPAPVPYSPPQPVPPQNW